VEGVDGVAYRVIWLSRLYNRDYLYYRAARAELVYMDASGDETVEGLDDCDDDNPYQVISLSDLPNMIHGRMFYLRAELNDEDAYLHFAYVGFA